MISSPVLLSPSPRALRRLLQGRFARTPWMRLASFSSGLVSLVSFWFLWLVSESERGGLDAVAIRTLAWASWVVALPACLGLISSLAALRTDPHLGLILRSFNLNASQIARASWLVSIRAVFIRLAIPSLGAGLIAGVVGFQPGHLTGPLLQLAASLSYISLLTLAIALFCSSAARLGAPRARWLLLLFLFLPSVAPDAWLQTFSVTHALNQILDGILRLGATP